jgi:hypothetical protein
MARIAAVAGVGLALGLFGTGCTHFIESRTVNKFADALEKKNVELAKSEATEEFNRKALRHAKALDDFEVLHLPDGKASVVKVEDESPTVKKVTVEVGKKKRKLLYKLVKNEKSGNWLVDDIYVRQQRKGATVTEPVTKQMDLLLTVREFLDAWDGGGRQPILNVVTPELGNELKSLPEPSLKQLARQVVGRQSPNKKLRPKASIDGAAAVVELPRTNGKMSLDLAMRDGKWKVADVTIRARHSKDDLPSLLKKAVVMRCGHDFLAAYAAGNRKQLEKLSTRKFYGESLRNSDLSLMPLHTPGPVKSEFEVTLEATRASYLVKEPTRWVRISLVPLEGKTDSSRTEYLVEDVAVHKVGTKQEIRLSSFFTGRAKATLFAAALARRDVAVLSKLSTGDFRRRVWDDVDSGIERSLPLTGLSDPRLTVDWLDFAGAVTELNGRQGNQDVTYVLREHQGQVYVDDVRVLKLGKPTSLKGSLELAVPILRFAAALRKADLAALQRVSSEDFNRLIWRQARVVPPSGSVVPSYLTGPIASVVRTGDETIVTLGDSRRGAKVKLVNQNGRYAVDEIVLIAGPRPSQQAALKQQMRIEMANSVTGLPGVSPRRQKDFTVITPAGATKEALGLALPRSTDPRDRHVGRLSEAGVTNGGISAAPTASESRATDPTGALLDLPLQASGALPEPKRSRSRTRQLTARIDPRSADSRKSEVGIVDVDVDPHGDAFESEPVRSDRVRPPRGVIRTSDTDPHLPRYQLR